MIGKQWAEDGAGKRQREIELAEERRILTEARRKEMADEERERVSVIERYDAVETQAKTDNLSSYPHIGELACLFEMMNFIRSPSKACYPHFRCL